MTRTIPRNTENNSRKIQKCKTITGAKYKTAISYIMKLKKNHLR